jgi:hypothetical protein
MDKREALNVLPLIIDVRALFVAVFYSLATSSSGSSPVFDFEAISSP